MEPRLQAADLGFFSALAMAGSLPGTILRANKQGFAGPDSRWFEGVLKSEVDGLVATSGGSILETRVAAELLEQSRRLGIGVRQFSWSFLAAMSYLKVVGARDANPSR